MQIIRKLPKPLVITLIVILPLVLLTVLIFGSIYLYSEAVIFDHRDCNTVRSFVPYREGYSVKYPRFGNPMMIGIDVDENGTTGRIYSLTLGKGGMKNVPVYDALNGPLCLWVDYIAAKYENRVDIDYTLEQDSRTVTVNLTVSAEDGDGNTVPVRQEFVFDIENASPNNLPEWVNQGSVTDEFREYLDYCNDPYENPMPDWYQEMLQKTE
ncbi:MAG: hypothetical protein NC203_07155 [Firmicutes bacterium]|nr:hypothetical protein [[Eubacterium] siraeum]MCM1488127.1 hypothetical protein [Bacillota bacterium]